MTEQIERGHDRDESDNSDTVFDNDNDYGRNEVEHVVDYSCNESFRDANDDNNAEGDDNDDDDDDDDDYDEDYVNGDDNDDDDQDDNDSDTSGDDNDGQRNLENNDYNGEALHLDQIPAPVLVQDFEHEQDPVVNAEPEPEDPELGAVVPPIHHPVMEIDLDPEIQDLLSATAGIPYEL